MFKKIINKILNKKSSKFDKNGNLIIYPENIDHSDKILSNYPEDKSLYDKTFTAKDLIDLYIELKSMQSNFSTINLDYLKKNNHPRYFRVLRLKALSEAFLDIKEIRITSCIEDGKFLHHFSEDKRNRILELIEAKHHKFSNSYLGQKKPDYVRETYSKQLSFAYKHLFQFKLDLYNFKYNGVIEASSYTFIDALETVGKVRSSLNDKAIEELDQLIEYYINPFGLNFNGKVLCEKYSFPKVDLHEVDIEWW